MEKCSVTTHTVKVSSETQGKLTKLKNMRKQSARRPKFIVDIIPQMIEENIDRYLEEEIKLLNV